DIPSYSNEWLYSHQPNISRVEGFQVFSAAQKTATLHILDMIAKATGLSFQEVPDSLGGELRFGMRTMSANTAGAAYEPGVDDGVVNDDLSSSANLDQQGTYGDVYLNPGVLGKASMLPGTEGFYVLMHEIAHALGITHAHGLPAAETTQDYTVMTESYVPEKATATHYGVYDLAALQHLYGNDAHEQSVMAEISQHFDGSSMTYTASAKGGTILGTDLHDLMQGAAGNDVLWGRGGDDLLTGGAGNDKLDGGLGNDSVLGGTGDDQLSGSWGADFLDGGSGHDVLNGGYGSDVLVANGDGDTLIGGDGAPVGVADTVDYSAATGAVRVELSTKYEENHDQLNFDGTRGYAWVEGTAKVAGMAGAGDSVININRVIGTAFDDYLSDSSFLYYDETLEGGAGNDTLVSHGSDFTDAKRHGDTLIGGPGDDRYLITIYQLNNKNLTLIEAANGGHDTIEITSGTAQFTIPDNIEDLMGDTWAKLDVTGNSLANHISAGSDQDVLRGEAGNDVLDGGAGNDSVDGGDGDDVLLGGAGANQLTGGAGADRFVFDVGSSPSDIDHITDFHFSEGDRIVLQHGLQYTLGSASNGEVQLRLSNGATVQLVGVALAQVADGWVLQG
ncbi:MAG: hypothetical protein HYZ45_08490, partial [Burkholderiales bacterium]|nr:hypothetical protein [Burkholderiales bacterium]